MKPNKAKQRKGIQYTLLAVCLVAMVGFGVLLWHEWRGDNEGQYFIDSLPIVEFVRPEIPVEAEIIPYQPAPPLAPAPDLPEEDVYIEEEPEPEPEPAPFAPVIDFDALRAEFPGIIGWIQLPGTNIDFPIVQGADNDFYLYRLPNHQANRMGSIFMDFRNAADFSDPVTFIYGHNMRSGEMFASLMNFSNQAFYEEHNRIFIFTPTVNYEVKIFAGYVIDNSVESPYMRFGNAQHFYDELERKQVRSLFNSETTPNFGDPLVILATCTNIRQVERKLIVGKLVQL